MKTGFVVGAVGGIVAVAFAIVCLTPGVFGEDDRAEARVGQADLKNGAVQTASSGSWVPTTTVGSLFPLPDSTQSSYTFGWTTDAPISNVQAFVNDQSISNWQPNQASVEFTLNLTPYATGDILRFDVTLSDGTTFSEEMAMQ